MTIVPHSGLSMIIAIVFFTDHLPSGNLHALGEILRVGNGELGIHLPKPDHAFGQTQNIIRQVFLNFMHPIPAFENVIIEQGIGIQQRTNILIGVEVAGQIELAKPRNHFIQHLQDFRIIVIPKAVVLGMDHIGNQIDFLGRTLQGINGFP